jgi:hypothetical protein
MVTDIEGRKAAEPNILGSVKEPIFQWYNSSKICFVDWVSLYRLRSSGWAFCVIPLPGNKWIRTTAAFIGPWDTRLFGRMNSAEYPARKSIPINSPCTR